MGTVGWNLNGSTIGQENETDIEYELLIVLGCTSNGRFAVDREFEYIEFVS